MRAIRSAGQLRSPAQRRAPLPTSASSPSAPSSREAPARDQPPSTSRAHDAEGNTGQQHHKGDYGQHDDRRAERSGLSGQRQNMPDQRAEQASHRQNAKGLL